MKIIKVLFFSQNPVDMDIIKQLFHSISSYMANSSSAMSSCTTRFRGIIAKYISNEKKENKFYAFSGIDPNIFGLLVRSVNQYTTRTNPLETKPVNVTYEVTPGIPRHYFLYG